MGSPYFRLDVEGVDFPLTATSADVSISGIIADVTVTQTYVNAGSQRLEATYVFPGSTNSAVYAMNMIIGNRRIKGEIQRKAEARATYEKAKKDGKRASLLEQHRPNVFQMNVANILPGDTVRVELKYTELLIPTNGIYSFVYPTVVGPRYVGADTSASPEIYTAQPYTPTDLPTYDFDLSVHLNAGMPISSVSSPSHKLSLRRSDEAVAIRLDGSERKGGNRDFVLEYNLQGNQIQTGMLTFEGEEENYFLYLAQPPAEVSDSDYPPREFIFVVDVSGSMTGFPLDVSKELLTNLIGELRPTDEFNVLLFAGTGLTWSEQSRPATSENLRGALAFMDRQDAGGGTDLLNALQTAYALPRSYTGLSRNIVIATDGYISVEPKAFELINSNLDQANVYTFGIGSGVNRHLIDGMARIGRGRPAYVLDPSDAEVEAARFQQYISEPVLTELTLDFGDRFDAYDVEPLSMPDISRERPLVVFGKYRGKAKGQLTLTGYGGYVGLDGLGSLTGLQTATPLTESDYRKRSITYNLRDADESDRNAALAQLWARERIRRLHDAEQSFYNVSHEEEIVQLGLDYNLLTQHTSFVAVEELIVADTDNPLQTVKQPLPLPQNVSATAVGFDLGLIGVSGLPKGQATGWPWALLAGGGLALLALCFRRLRWPVAVCSLLLFLASCDLAKKTSSPEKLQLARQPENITFILGQDEGTNAYYARATEYFRTHPAEGGERVLTNFRSISEIRDFIASSQVQSYYENINVVVHGNQWTGLAAKLSPEATTERVTAAALARWHPKRKMPSNRINTNTKIIIHGCSVGRDTALLAQISRLFGNRGGEFPTVSASEDFTLFRKGSSGMEKHYADYVYRARPLGNYPLPKVMANRLRRQFPEKQVDWDVALSNDRFSEALQPHLYRFNVPVRWTQVYPERNTVATPSNATAEKDWLAGQTQLMGSLDKIGLRHRDFLWKFTAEDYRLEDGGSVPAVTAEGVTQLFCVLLPRARGEGVEMVRVRWADT